MGYMSILNLYKNQTILLFKKVYALEKIHGTSAHISFRRVTAPDGTVNAVVGFFAGGEKYDNFVALFDQEDLKRRFLEAGPEKMIVYGEAYGGKQQGMRDTYGPKLKFVAFDVRIGAEGDGVWLGVESANMLVDKLGLEFVAWNLVDADSASLDRERDLPSRQAVRNGILEPKIAEGVVLRPPIELYHNGSRIIAKHKRPEFSERTSKRDTVVDAQKLEILTKAQDIAAEWVTPMRLEHVLSKLEAGLGRESAIEDVPQIIAAMVEDVTREAVGEIALTREAAKAIGSATVKLFKRRQSKALNAAFRPAQTQLTEQSLQVENLSAPLTVTTIKDTP
jgi:hypothetical protein